MKKLYHRDSLLVMWPYDLLPINIIHDVDLNDLITISIINTNIFD
jgi:hypothetical protein